MDNTLAYALSLGGFIGMAGWWSIFGKNIIGRNLIGSLVYTAIYVMLGVLSLKYIDILPVEFISPFRIVTVALALVGGFAIIFCADTKRLIEPGKEEKE